jgi:hypothetical protein
VATSEHLLLFEQQEKIQNGSIKSAMMIETWMINDISDDVIKSVCLPTLDGSNGLQKTILRKIEADDQRPCNHHHPSPITHHINILIA